MDENQPHQYNLHQSDQTSPKIDAEVVEDAKHNMKCTDTSSPSTSAPLSEISLDETKTAEFKNSSSEFFHFVRLMQLFPSVHPATLHTVMTMCKSDFFVAVDRLLYAKRCKELYDTKRRMFQCAPKNNNRYAPYSCTSDICAQGLSRMRSPNVKMEPTGKKSSRKSRVEKNSSSGQFQMQLQQQQIHESPITLQCNVPLRPLSPMPEAELTLSNNNIEGVAVEGVEVVVTQV